MGGTASGWSVRKLCSGCRDTPAPIGICNPNRDMYCSFVCCTQAGLAGQPSPRVSSSWRCKGASLFKNL
eukprot:jgi/Botrbrau1/10926/Bobra.0025s0099.1